MQNIRRLTTRQIAAFRALVYAEYARHKRLMPWRWIDDPYRVLVSEVMLQQTQVERVMKKYPEFIRAFPTVQRLAVASLGDILAVWQGMGYNRRALALSRAARAITRGFCGEVPRSVDDLESLDGIGPQSARSIAVFAFNQPHAFIETNIRSVFLHHFFSGRTGVKDEEIIPLVAQALDGINPREWYYALMDYGTVLKRRFPNPSRRSAHYAVQSRFHGSTRQLRGRILRGLVGKNRVRAGLLRKTCGAGPARFGEAVRDLVREGMIRNTGGYLRI